MEDSEPSSPVEILYTEKERFFQHAESPLIALPILVLGTIGLGYILVYFSDILIPFVISLFFVYILRPVVDFIHKPFDECCPKLFEGRDGDDDYKYVYYTKLGKGNTVF